MVVVVVVVVVGGGGGGGGGGGAYHRISMRSTNTCTKYCFLFSDLSRGVERNFTSQK